MNFKIVALAVVMLLSASYIRAQQADTIFISEDYYALTLGQVLKDLQIHYDLEIDFNPSDIRGIMVSSRHYEMTLQAFMKKILDHSDLHFKIVEQKIQIRKKDTILTLKDKDYKPQTDFTLIGLVRDQLTGEILPYAQVLVNGTSNGAICNVDGYFTLFHVPTDTSVLLVSYVGYRKKEVKLTPRLVNNKFFIDLVPMAEQLEDVNVIGEREDLMQVSSEVSVLALTPKEIAALPSLGEKDIFRTFQLLPGISGSNEGSSGLYVRGGTPDQNLILYDGFTVYHVDHLFGMFSTFNSNAIIDVQLFKGGFESRYGGRLSSVMDIVGKDGNENNFNLGLDLSFLSLNTYTEFPIGKKATFLFAFRRSYKSALYSKIFDNFNTSNNTVTQFGGPGGGGPPMRSVETADPLSNFYDLNGKLSFHPTKNDIISLSLFNGKDVLDNSRDISRSFGGMPHNGDVNDLTDWGNWGSSLKWSRRWSENLYSNALISFSDYFSTRDRTSERSWIDEDTITQTSTQGTLEDNNLKDYSFKIDNELALGRNHHTEFGFQTNLFNINYLYTRDDTLTIQNRDDEGFLSAIYLQDTWTPLSRLSITPGIRLSYFSNSSKFYLEPRLSAYYALSDKIKLKGAWGLYYQFVQRVIREDIQAGSRDFWLMADDNHVPVSSAIHYIAGASYETKNYLFDIEGYYKSLDYLTEYTLRYIPQFGSTDYNEYYYEGSGYAMGVEFLLQKKFGQFSGWLGYTLGEVIYSFPVYGDVPFPAGHDVTNELKFVGIYKWKDWSLSATWIYATGKPYTEPIGAYEIMQPDGTIQDYILVGPKNGSRYPDYHRLDLAINRKVKFGDMGIGSLSFSIFNLYNRKNVWYKEFEVEDGQLIETNVTLLGITPNLTLSFSLR